MNEKERMSGTIFDEQGEMIVWEQLMASYSDDTFDQHEHIKEMVRTDRRNSYE